MSLDNQDLYSNQYQVSSLVAYHTGSVVSRTLINKKSGTVTLFAFDENGSLSEHAAPFDAMVLVIDGEAEIIINSKPYHLKSNDMIIMPANIPHAVKAITAFKMMLTMVKEI